VEFPGFVPQKDLIELYRRALVFVYPSYYEGFGFPVLEAMASGTPVVTSNVSSLPEVAGDAAVLVDPYRVDAIAAGIARVLNFDDVQYHRQIQKGLAQSQKFSWQKCARETLEVLKLFTKTMTERT
jgi:glycosyltransferase involved in cell wall biosynthesis